jgi:hypothetical protein
MKHRPFFKFPLSALITVAMLYVVFTVFAMLGNWSLDWIAVRDQLWGPRCALLLIGSFIAGALRVALFHPRFSSRYANWLAGTPWHAGRDLPLGPVKFVPEDLLYVVPLMVLSVADANVFAWVPLCGYVLGYCMLCIASVRDPSARWFALGLFLLASFPLLWYRQVAVLYAALAVATVIAHVGLEISLRHFPWDLGDSMRDLKKRPRAGLSWPFDRLAPFEPPTPISPAMGFATAAIIGWWIYVLLASLIQVSGDLGLMLANLMVSNHLPVICVVFAFLRWIAYCGLYWPPISLWGRVRTGRLIIPGYDYVFITPLLMCGVSLLLPRLLLPHLSPAVVGGTTAAFAAALFFNGGPTIRSWRLTGHHRLVAGGRREPVAPKARTGRL